MKYRRFGKTELQIPILSCGGMRYQQSWQDIDPKALERKGQENLEATIRRSLDLGINHIETARGYGSSEYQLGFILPNLPRDEMIIQTKVPPKDSEKEFLETFETSMKYLKLDYVDLLGVHGINNPDLLEKTLSKGTLKACRRLQKEGRVRHVGFSTHGGPDDILPSIRCGEFDYVNLHWYYIDQRNWIAIEEARRQDMGVFIISPSDKGGKLYQPPEKLVELCRPLNPMTLNDWFCLSHPEVHTISIGASRPTDFDEHVAALALLDDDGAAKLPRDVLARLDAEQERVLGAEWFHHWQEGLPHWSQVPGEVNLYHILRLHNLVKAFDMVEFGKMRYNLLGNADHWFPGNKCDKMEWERLADALKDYPLAEQVPAKLREAHELLKADEVKRQSESGD